MQPSAADIGCRSIEQVAAAELAAVLREFAGLETAEQRLAERAAGKVRGERRATAVARPGPHHRARRLLSRLGPDDVDHADEAGRSIGHRRRAADDLDAVDIDRIERCSRRVERAAERDAVDHQQIGVELGQALEGDDAACRATVAAGQHLDPRRRAERAAKIGRSARADVVAADHRLRRGNADVRLGLASDRDDDRLFRSAGRSGGRCRECGRDERGWQDLPVHKPPVSTRRERRGGQVGGYSTAFKSSTGCWPNGRIPSTGGEPERQNFLVTPTKKPRRCPHCGAPTPTPSPLRI